jgi:hypothetical protein
MSLELFQAEKLERRGMGRFEIDRCGTTVLEGAASAPLIRIRRATRIR